MVPYLTLENLAKQETTAVRHVRRIILKLLLKENLLIIFAT